MAVRADHPRRPVAAESFNSAMQPSVLQCFVDETSTAMHAKADEVELLASHRIDGSPAKTN